MPNQSPLIEADDMLRQRFGNADVCHPILTIELEAKITSAPTAAQNFNGA